MQNEEECVSESREKEILIEEIKSKIMKLQKSARGVNH